MRRSMKIVLTVFFVGVGTLATISYATRPSNMALSQVLAEPDPVAGAALYAEYCAACHGADLSGAPDWRSPKADGTLPPPPHDETGHTWHHGDKLLFDYTKLGGQAALAAMGVSGVKSGMPGFGEQLSDAEIHNILAFIKSTWPDRIAEIQKQRSLAEQGAGE